MLDADSDALNNLKRFAALSKQVRYHVKLLMMSICVCKGMNLRPWERRWVHFFILRNSFLHLLIYFGMSWGISLI